MSRLRVLVPHSMLVMIWAGSGWMVVQLLTVAPYTPRERKWEGAEGDGKRRTKLVVKVVWQQWRSVATQCKVRVTLQCRVHTQLSS